MVKEVTVKNLGPGSSPRCFFNRIESIAEASSRMLVKEYTDKSFPEGRLSSLFRGSGLTITLKPPPKASRTDLEPRLQLVDTQLRPSYISTGYVSGPNSPKYVVSRILVQNGDFLYEKFVRMTEYTKILYGAISPLSAFGEPLRRVRQFSDQLAGFGPTGRITTNWLIFGQLAGCELAQTDQLANYRDQLANYRDQLADLGQLARFHFYHLPVDILFPPNDLTDHSRGVR